MKATIIPIMIGAFGTVTKGLLKELEDLEVGGRVETIQTTTLLRTARILRRVLETCCHLNSNENPTTDADVKNFNGDNNWSLAKRYVSTIYLYINQTLRTSRM